MVSLRTIVLAALPVANAYITGFTAPATATAGTPFNVTLGTASYSQNWDDFSIIWGIVTPAANCEACVGTQIGYTPLTGSEGSTYPYTFTEAVTVPEGTAAGTYVLKAALPRLVGASGTTGFSYYSSNITVS